MNLINLEKELVAMNESLVNGVEVVGAFLEGRVRDVTGEWIVEAFDASGVLNYHLPIPKVAVVLLAFEVECPEKLGKMVETIANIQANQLILKILVDNVRTTTVVDTTAPVGHTLH